MVHCIIPSSLTAECLADGDGLYRCTYDCSTAGDMVGISVDGIGALLNISVEGYQYIECPEGRYGPGCELACECSEREICHFVKGCYIGKESTRMLNHTQT